MRSLLKYLFYKTFYHLVISFQSNSNFTQNISKISTYAKLAGSNLTFPWHLKTIRRLRLPYLYTYYELFIQEYFCFKFIFIRSLSHQAYSLWVEIYGRNSILRKVHWRKLIRESNPVSFLHFTAAILYCDPLADYSVIIFKYTSKFIFSHSK